VTLPPSSEPSINTLTPEDTLLELLIANSFDDGAALLAMGTPQRSAYEWLSNNTNITDYSDEVKLARYALATFYYSTNGPTAWDEEIRNDAWVTDAPECEWATTASNQCSDNVYTSLTLDFVGVSGQIPEELALLTGLTRLSLRSEGIGMPSISGSLPESIGLLGNLETIRLNENNIGGTLPTTIGLLSNIRVFLLSGNSIEGSIPSEIGQTSGSTFNFDRNELSGKLPKELFTMETLTALNFEENNLSGTIPTEIGKNPNLNSVNLASNSLTGTIPSEIGNLVTAKGKLCIRIIISCFMVYAIL
jgi:Leucine-rich repeat (LRR) protein